MDAQRLLKHLELEEQQAKRASAASWTFIFTTSPSNAGYSAEMGGFSKARDFLVRQCKPANASIPR